MTNRASQNHHKGVEIAVVTRTEEAPQLDTLGELARVLGAAGLCVRLTQPLGRPLGLHIQNPAQPALNEHITLDDGRFWWGWSEPLAPADRVDEAAAAIVRAVGATRSR